MSEPLDPQSADGSDYDIVAYPGHAFPDTHPGRLAAIGVLHGMAPAPVEQCRVLELGCGDGANLVPMAYELPGATFLGIDLAASPIARGKEFAAALGLGNVRLEVMDICAMAPDLGPFDYIIAHGVYSWVPEPVRDCLLAVCGAMLAPNGIAFVSYLAQPGTQMRDVLRQALLRYGGDSSDPAERIQQARALIRAFGGQHDSPDPFQQALRRAARELNDEWADGSLFHDWLAAINAPMRVTDFVAHARRHGLEFLGEAEYVAMCWQHDPLLREARGLLAAAEAQDILLKEQLLDDLRCRRFRQTLLCRAGVRRSAPTPARALRLAVSARLQPVGDPDAAGSAIAEFRSPHDVALRVDHPVAKAALLELSREWPRPIPGSELLAAARAAVGRTAPGSEAGDADVLGAVLLACADAGHAEFSAWVPRFPIAAGERPRVSAVARFNLARGTRITTLRHEPLKVDDALSKQLIALLDGTRTRTELVAELARQVLAGELEVPVLPADRDTDLQARLAEGLERSLTGLAQAGLLET